MFVSLSDCGDVRLAVIRKGRQPISTKGRRLKNAERKGGTTATRKRKEEEKGKK